MKERRIPFLPQLGDGVPEGYEFSETLKDDAATHEMIYAYAEHLADKGARVSRIVKDREHKATDTVKVDVPSNVPYVWLGTHNVKSKERMSQKDINRARRANRLYKTSMFTYSGAKAMFAKRNSRKHRQLREDRIERYSDDDE